MLNSGYSVDVLDLHSLHRYDDNSVSRSLLSEGMIFEQCDSESDHIQYTASPPVNRTGDFNRLKIEAVLSSSVRKS